MVREKKMKNKSYTVSLPQSVCIESKIYFFISNDYDYVSKYQAEEEMKKKLELINQIKAAEAAPLPRHHKQVDLTQTSGMRLLSEMSVAELRERLSLIKIERKEMEEKKRDEILENKQVRWQYYVFCMLQKY